MASFHLEIASQYLEFNGKVKYSLFYNNYLKEATICSSFQGLSSSLEMKLQEETHLESQESEEGGKRARKRVLFGNYPLRQEKNHQQLSRVQVIVSG